MNVILTIIHSPNHKEFFGPPMVFDKLEFHQVVLFNFIIQVYKIVTAEDNHWKYLHDDKGLKRDNAVWRRSISSSKDNFKIDDI